MKKLLSLSAVLTIALFIGAACQAASTANVTVNNTNQTLANNSAAPTADEHAHADDAPRITLADAKKDFDAGTAIFVDTRGAASYDNEHIKGAINLSADMFDAKYKDLPKDKKIIAYCS